MELVGQYVNVEDSVNELFGYFGHYLAGGVLAVALIWVVAFTVYRVMGWINEWTR